MQKYGWQPGDGLGSERQGDTDYLQPKFKDDQRGLGCSIQHENNWLAHNDDFNAILATLNKKPENSATGMTVGNAKLPTTMPLEEKSKSTKGRIHYHKFAKGKDLSCRSKEDISSIFGGRIPSAAPTRQQKSDDISISAIEVISPEVSFVTGLHTTTSSDNIQDYFQKKLKQKKEKMSSPLEPEQKELNNDIPTRDVLHHQKDDYNGIERIPAEPPVSVESCRTKKKRKRVETVVELVPPEIVCADDQELDDVYHVEDAVEESQNSPEMTTAESGIDQCSSVKLTETEVVTQTEKVIKKKRKRVEENSVFATEMSSDFAVVEKILPEMHFSKSVKEQNPVIRSEKISRDVETTNEEKKETTTVTRSFVKTFYGLSMESVRNHFRRLSDEQKGNIFPGSNIFEIVGYGDELLH
ncbi:PIN2/TERF1-interacting telomerase inhibitor 1-like isoform X1 [Paramacrobiotus metropolitanus]|nr:PIN2/TERF1-interacting telomerase inhibitor 1-like isoform X1 [Paramacrobiotus metropolitanus]XP_055347246.1 PIN2/TERF1-interacting telomerase inhibitor 1-like isoform X1 [Paramacrobiotus metropolitanus]XP_055347247.1 PIN2/TERF1-interacting telomerase inhibitor 1-like isoform X1 [Paramacrobiotus metropolitanus]XP_055347248.1 PIN2/TERF1-interacting telomerase inhibitor 1-like isoform X1 [Paramacrobiotus metropolitanus]